MKFLEGNGIKAIGFDAFGTLIDDSKRPRFNLSRIFKNYGLNLRETDLMIKSYSENPEEYYQELFDYLFQKEGKGRSYEKDVSNEDKDIILQNYKLEVDSYVLRPQTEKFLAKIKSEIDYIFLISNLSSVYVRKVEELLNSQDFLFKLYSCDVGLQKTIKNTDIFNLSHEILHRDTGLGIKTNEILFSGDKEANDEIAPKKAGFQAINIDKLRHIILDNN